MPKYTAQQKEIFHEKNASLNPDVSGFKNFRIHFSAFCLRGSRTGNCDHIR
jgi:hypothetical protein